MTINQIIKPVSKELDKFNKYFKELLRTDVALLNLIIKYLTRKRGKQVRPAMVLLSSLLGGEINQRSNIGAALVELVHTATLIHDDVVDEADERRGIASINAQWNNKIAILIGDFLLAKGLLTAVDGQEYSLLQISTNAVRRMSEGELLSIEKSRTMRVSEEDYYRITSGKTASLLSACCEIGIAATSNDESQRIAMKQYGEFIGIAFQIRDDIFDFISNSFALGKPVGNDLKEKKITLPLIHTFSKLDMKESVEIIKEIKKGKLKNVAIDKIINKVIDLGGIEYAQSKALEFSLNAKKQLDIFPDSIAKTALTNFADFVIKREF